MKSSGGAGIVNEGKALSVEALSDEVDGTVPLTVPGEIEEMAVDDVV